MIGRNIRRLRERKHLTQEELAEKIGVTRQAVSNWENERTKPDIETGLVLSRILDTSLEEIVCGVKNAASEESADCSVNQEVHENVKCYSAGRNAEKGKIDCSMTGECAQSEKTFGQNDAHSRVKNNVAKATALSARIPQAEFFLDEERENKR